ncbi:MAG: bifunctional transaldolase/phosoglucose isomerase [Sphaerobacteraceae bacterium]|nr:MAG: bifunctional transaldolase/phosoglucose isomerase [Sphaerobacteraceae bacterium]
MSNPLRQLADVGQSFWLDNLSRELISSGELQGLIDNDGLRGITSNPTIFEKAFSSGDSYDSDIAELASEDHSVEQVFELLAIEDIRNAADKLRPLYDETGGADGFVSLELPPSLAYDTNGSISEAKRLFGAVDRPNVMIKVPGTAEGIPAIETLLTDGVNVNITLLFSLDGYINVAEAYLRAMKKRVETNRPLNTVASVASFFVSRVDSEVDSRLQAIIESGSDPDARARAEALSGKVAIANARIAYQEFRKRFTDNPEFAELQQQGAQIQRPLWASTSTKNPDYPDTLYIEALIGPHTVETMAPASVDAFRDHGTVRVTIEDDVEAARQTLDELSALGIDYQDMTRSLQEKGVELFAESYDQLLAGLSGKMRKLQGPGANLSWSNMESCEEPIGEALGKLESQQATTKLLAGDPSLWSDDPQVQKTITNRLGWVHAHKLMLNKRDEFEQLSADIKQAGFTRAVLLGMGGSSLAPEVLHDSLGSRDGFPSLRVLDTTNPDTIARVRNEEALGETLFIVSSKSGSTIETATLMSYFWQEMVAEVGAEQAGKHFIAITDPGSALEDQARQFGFRGCYLNPADIGGRYSAISYFGLIPAAIIGLDVAELLKHVPNDDADLRLGATIGALARQGRDKLTFVLPESISGLADWLEQLIAESTGKEGTGIVPISKENASTAASYGSDRVFVGVQLMNDPDESIETFLRSVEQQGHPTIRIAMPDVSYLAAEFYRWEVATAFAGAVLDINPFDEPNVQEAKDLTNQLLDQYREQGSLPIPSATQASDAVSVAGGDPAALRDPFTWFLNQIRLGDYLAILAYTDTRPEIQERLNEIRRLMRDRLGVATTLGYGPRYLHSIGQLYKGGPPMGAFLQIVTLSDHAIEIPDRDYPFDVLFAAQALGDFQAMQERARPVLRLVTSGDEIAALDEIVSSVLSAATK